MLSVSKKTTRVGTSTTHNEYIAQAEMGKCLDFNRKLYVEMGFPEVCNEPTSLLLASRPSTALASPAAVNGRVLAGRCCAALAAPSSLPM